MNNHSILRALYEKSRAKKGHIYFLKQDGLVKIRMSKIPDDAFIPGSNPKRIDLDKVPQEAKISVDQYKYGKTSNLKKRLDFYPKSYKLLKSYKVNHLSLREELIRQDNEISDDRDLHGKHYKDEHVEFDCSDIVDLYATGTFKYDKIHNRIEFYDKDNNFILDVPEYCIMNIIKM